MYLNFITIFLIFIPNIEAAGQIRSLIIESAGPCPNNNKLPSRIKNMTVYNSHGKAVVYLDTDVTEILRAPLEIRVEGERCDMQKTQCSQAPGVNFPDLCLVTDSLYAQMIFTKLEPPITKCPVPKNNYVMKNVEIEHEKWIQMIPFPTGRYSFKYGIYDFKQGKKRLAACWLLAFKIQMSSKRRN